MIAWLAAAALADPGALRAPGTGEAWQLTVAWPDVAVSGWVGDLGVYASAEERFALYEAGVGGAATLVGRDRTWGVDVVGSAGIGVPRVRPSPLLALTPSIRAGARGDRAHATLALVTPIAWDVLDPAALRVGTEGELRLGARLGAVWLSGFAGMGPAFVPGGLVAIDGRAGVSVGLVPAR